jgi:hypothetical protein
VPFGFITIGKHVSHAFKGDAKILWETSEKMEKEALSSEE